MKRPAPTPVLQSAGADEAPDAKRQRTSETAGPSGRYRYSVISRVASCKTRCTDTGALAGVKHSVNMTSHQFLTSEGCGHVCPCLCHA